jgi:hypothetical protein
LFGGENLEMGSLQAWDISCEDLREAPLSERSFLAGETEAEFHFQPPIGKLGTFFIMDLGMFQAYSIVHLFFL